VERNIEYCSPIDEVGVVVTLAFSNKNSGDVYAITVVWLRFLRGTQPTSSCFLEDEKLSVLIFFLLR